MGLVINLIRVRQSIIISFLLLSYFLHCNYYHFYYYLFHGSSWSDLNTFDFDFWFEMRHLRRFLKENMPSFTKNSRRWWKIRGILTCPTLQSLFQGITPIIQPLSFLVVCLYLVHVVLKKNTKNMVVWQICTCHTYAGCMQIARMACMRVPVAVRLVANGYTPFTHILPRLTFYRNTSSVSY